MGRLLLVENSVIIVKGITSLVKNSGIDDIDVVGTLDETPARLKKNVYNLAFVSLSLKNIKQIEEVQTIIKNHPTTSFLLFVEGRDFLLERKIYQMGALGIINKTESIEEILRAIQQVWNGEIYLNKNFLSKLLCSPTEQTRFTNELSPAFNELTPREKIIVSYFLRGKKNAEICRELSLKPSTVSTFKTNIFNKLNINSLIELENMKSDVSIAFSLQDRKL